MLSISYATADKVINTYHRIHELKEPVTISDNDIKFTIYPIYRDLIDNGDIDTRMTINLNGAWLEMYNFKPVIVFGDMLRIISNPNVELTLEVRASKGSLKITYGGSNGPVSIVIPNDPEKDLNDIIKDLYPTVWAAYGADDIISIEEC